jgi:ribonucleotide reductase beta subunit family protein with ferritin-like domain
MKGSVKMINLINADKVLKQLYLSMVEKELNKVKEQPKVNNKEAKEEKNETSDIV